MARIYNDITETIGNTPLVRLHRTAEELGINVFHGGHYATETFGVKALAAHLARHFHLDQVFLDHPTGL